MWPLFRLKYLSSCFKLNYWLWNQHCEDLLQFLLFLLKTGSTDKSTLLYNPLCCSLCCIWRPACFWPRCCHKAVKLMPPSVSFAEDNDAQSCARATLKVTFLNAAVEFVLSFLWAHYVTAHYTLISETSQLMQNGAAWRSFSVTKCLLIILPWWMLNTRFTRVFIRSPFGRMYLFYLISLQLWLAAAQVDLLEWPSTCKHASVLIFILLMWRNKTGLMQMNHLAEGFVCAEQ